MTYFFLSFCDTSKPRGSQFLGSACVSGTDAEDALENATALGLNPGGEVAIVELPCQSLKDIPKDGLKYVNNFIPRETAMAEGRTLEQDEIDAGVCQDCNPRKFNG